MSRTPDPRTPRRQPRVPANDRLKRRWSAAFWTSMLAAVAVHAAALGFGPRVHLATRTAARLEAAHVVSFRIPGVQEVSHAPGAIAAPEIPTVADLDLDLTLEGVGLLPTFTDADVAPPVAPPVYTLRDEWLDYESFAPILVAPSIRNRVEMRRFLETNYRPIVEFSGAQGVVMVHFWVDETGSVARAEVAQSSGSRSLDRLAMRVSRILRFSPAMRLGRPVRVLVRLPITFRQT